jgi:mono/diheme cytochrome c family protein
VSLPHRVPSAARPAPYLVALTLAAALLPGCQNNYSEAMVYPIRTDPILGELNKTTEYDDPDRPGQLPIFTVKDFDDDRNPFYPQRQALLDNPKNRDVSRLDPKLKQELEDVLRWVFGTPAMPKVDVEYAGLDDRAAKARKELVLSGDVLAEGSRLYRQHCLHCHGLTGDGRGPTSKWVNPHPRDYRQGLFKFTSVDQTEKTLRPRREDLLRVLHQGIEGTAMPAFNLLPEPELEALVSYVIHLSLRGYAEYEVLSEMQYTAKDGFSVPPAWKGLQRYMLYAAGPAA